MKKYNTVKASPVTAKVFNTKKIVITPGGKWLEAGMSGCNRPLPIRNKPKVINHIMAERIPVNSSAPNGHNIAQITKPLALKKPPRATVNKKGNRNSNNNWLKRNSGKL